MTKSTAHIVERVILMYAILGKKTPSISNIGGLAKGIQNVTMQSILQIYETTLL